MKRLIRSFLFFTVLSSGLILAKPGIYVYVIPFENLQDDEAISWLSDAFVEMVNGELRDLDDVILKDKEGLEAVMANRSLLLQQRRGSKNLLVLGKYERALNKVTVSVQLVDINTWDELDRRKIAGDYNDIKQLNRSLTEMIRTMLTPYLPEKKAGPYPALKKGKGMTKPPAYGQRAFKVGESIDVALDKLVGARGVVDTTGVREKDGEWVLDISMEPFHKDNPENTANTNIMLNVLNNLMSQPYHVEIEKPKFEFDPGDRKKFNVILPVSYSLKGNIIKDMLSSLPYSGLKQEGSLTIFYFNRDNFNFPPSISEKISRGTYRAVPVIQFLNQSGEPIAVFVDSPDMNAYERDSQRLIYKPFHFFSPLIDFTIGGWSMQVALETVEIQARYTVTMDIEKARDISRVSLKFIPEDELPSFLNRIL
jgi:TolB-like protein